MKSVLYIALFAVLCCTATVLNAAKYHFTPAGSGDGSGSGFENALSQKDIQGKLNAAQPGDIFLLGSGTYHPPYDNNRLLVLKLGGTAELPIEFRGVDTGEGLPLIEGRWKETNVRYHAHSSTAIAISAGVGHMKFSDLKITGCMHGITTSGGSVGLHFSSIAIDRCREGFRLNGISDSTFTDCSVIRYTKLGMRLEADCNGLQLDKVSVDATGGDADWPTEAFPFGFHIEQHKGNFNIVYRHCTARNNLFKSESDKYWNGDGFVAENASCGIVYEDCASLNNTDGGWDDKSHAARIVRCKADGNKRGFRIWNTAGTSDEPTVLENCVASGNASRGGIGSSAGLWSCGYVEAVDCTFSDNATFAVALENNNSGGHAVLKRCLLQIKAGTKQQFLQTESGTTCEEIDVVRETIE